MRLTQGAFNQVETYSDDPVKYALRWEQEGAGRLHMVDLDGARIGAPQTDNLNVIRQILRRVKIPIQLGGGIRSAEIVQRMLNIGIDRVILGTSAAQDESLAQGILDAHGDRIIVGIDAKDGFVAIRGWQERTNETAVAFAQRIVRLGARRIIFTDIGRDGMLTGPNYSAIGEVLDAVSIPVIASGGVGSLEDIRMLAGFKAPNLEGAIVGKALYAGRLTVEQAIAVSGVGV